MSQVRTLSSNRASSPGSASPVQLAGATAAALSHILVQSSQYLGVEKFMGQPSVDSRMGVHRIILEGMPFASLQNLVGQFKGLGEADVANVLGVSTRTLSRQKETPDKPMPVDLASKTWLFAEMLARATEVFGSEQRAEEWMAKPARGLDGQRPLDLLRTVQGTELVSDFLTRLDHGVYS